MSPEVSDRTGILIVRLWFDTRASDGFRARITQTLDSSEPAQTTTTAGTPEDLYEQVRRWVERFALAR